MHRTGPKPLQVYIATAIASGKDQAAIQSMLEGIKTYQNSQIPLPVLSGGAVYEEAGIALYAYGSGEFPVLLVPSLINGPEILDLHKDKSFAQFLAQHNMRVYILDWGDVCARDTACDFTKLLQGDLLKAAQFIKSESGRNMHALGYCMGGTMLAGLVSVLDDQVDIFASISLLATPWDFHVEAPRLTKAVELWKLKADMYLQERSMLPVDWVQSVFATLDPENTVKKFSKLAGMAKDDPGFEVFIAVEDWLASGHGLPAPIAKEVIQDWFAYNNIVHGKWLLGGEAVRAQNIKVPALVIASPKDHLVHYASSHKFREQCTGSNVDLIEPDCGHIGMMAGRSAEEKVWEPIKNWIMKQESNCT